MADREKQLHSKAQMRSTYCPEFVCFSFRKWQVFSIIHPLGISVEPWVLDTYNISKQSYRGSYKHTWLNHPTPWKEVKTIDSGSAFLLGIDVLWRLQVGQFTGLWENWSGEMNCFIEWLNCIPLLNYFCSSLFVYPSTKQWGLHDLHKIVGRLCNTKVLTLLKHAVICWDYSMLFPLRMMAPSSIK